MEYEYKAKDRERSHCLYINQLNEELKFLWQDANSVEEWEMKERKLRQFWELYRFYRKQKEFLSQI
jgi:hypothetical protein